MTKDEWLRNRLVAAYWCGKMRAMLAAKHAPKRAPTESPQLTLPFIWSPPK